ncbi:cathelicidin-related peptide Oh-Cath-like isoform X1 [Scyliorhinus torazame]|uniref:cathelicidin-related peptide Oh-Cath-like isoform X1 n=1 Tax=Scyliorhinus torazame TaxID=75743 RepID=UPI003B5ACE2F
MRSWLTALVCIGAVAVGKGSPVQRTPTSTDALLAAIYKYNAGSGQLNLFKLMATYCIAIKQMPQGKEYEIGFSLKQTVCTKGMEDVMQDCEYMDNGTILICNSVITIRFNVPVPTKITVNCSPQD